MNLDVIEVLAILAAGFTAGSIFTIGIYKIATHEKDKEEEPISVLYKALRDDIHDYNDCILNRLKSIEKYYRSHRKLYRGYISHSGFY